MGFFFCFYDNENNIRNMIEPEKYRKNDIFNDGVEDEYGDGDDGDDTNEVAEEYKNLVIVDEEDLDQN